MVRAISPYGRKSMKQSDGFLGEMKRRKVVRVAVVYGAVAFAEVQAADIAFPRIPLPDWTVSLVVWLAILGFPIALVLGWAFDMTPDGVKRTPAEVPERVVSSGRWMSLRSGALAVGILAFGLGGGWWAGQGKAPTMSATLSATNAAMNPEDRG